MNQKRKYNLISSNRGSIRLVNETFYFGSDGFFVPLDEEEQASFLKAINAEEAKFKRKLSVKEVYNIVDAFTGK